MPLPLQSSFRNRNILPKNLDATTATIEEVQALLKDLTTTAQAYLTAPDRNGIMSRIEIIAKAKKLTQALTPPERLPDYHGLNMAEEIASKLRSLPQVTAGFIDQTRSDGGDYKHTKFSQSHVTSKGPSPGYLFLATYDEWFKKMHNFDDYLIGRGQLAHTREPDDRLNNPYTWTHKQDGAPVWAIMAKDPERIQISKLEYERVELVDVGGGHGACLKQILDNHPELNSKKCVLRDRPDVIEMAKASGILPKDVVMMPHDFRTEQPVKDAKGYFMRMILHDYADFVCIDILTHLAKAMAPDSRVLVVDMVLPQRVGEADFTAAVLDQAVMTTERRRGWKRDSGVYSKLLACTWCTFGGSRGY